MQVNELSEKDVFDLLEKQHHFFNTNTTKNIAFRIQQLISLKKMIKNNEAKLLDALYLDLRKHRNEAFSTEIGIVYRSITDTIKHLRAWAKPKKVHTPLFVQPSKGYIVHEPYGSVLVIGPYNYPVQLILEPIVGIIAAGNTAIIKPSEMAPNVSKVLREIFSKTFPEKYIACVEGGIETTTSLINSRFDHIFFTGSPQVGKIVMQAAAKNLVPVTLELGGKSPVIVDESANIKQAARRIIWGKTLNAGQTCVAPDYVIVHESVKAPFIEALKQAIRTSWGDTVNDTPTMCKIINNKHFDRISNILETNKDRIVFGGNRVNETRYIEPTILDVDWDSTAMAEEIFGPVLPILTYTNLDDTIRAIKTREKPLAFYIFSRNKHTISKLIHEVSSGSVGVNSTIMQIVNPNLPFGGVGNSGIGSYHGRESFYTFSHRKSVLKKPARFDIELAYAPYTEKQFDLIKKFLH